LDKALLDKRWRSCFYHFVLGDESVTEVPDEVIEVKYVSGGSEDVTNLKRWFLTLIKSAFKEKFKENPRERREYDTLASTIPSNYKDIAYALAGDEADEWSDEQWGREANNARQKVTRYGDRLLIPVWWENFLKVKFFETPELYGAIDHTLNFCKP